MKLKLKIKLKKIIPYGLLAFYLFFTIISFIYTPPKHNITRKELEEINLKNRQKHFDKKNKNNPQLIQSSQVVEQQTNQTIKESSEKDKDGSIQIPSGEHIKQLEFQCYDNRTSIYDVFSMEQQTVINTQENLNQIVQKIDKIQVSNSLWKQYFLYEYMAPPQQIMKQTFKYNELWKKYLQQVCNQIEYYYLDEQDVKFNEENNYHNLSIVHNHSQIWKQYFFYSFSDFDELNITINEQTVFNSQTLESDKRFILNNEDQVIIENQQQWVKDDHPIISMNQSEFDINNYESIDEDQIYQLNNSLSQTEIDNTIIVNPLNQTGQDDQINQQDEILKQQQLKQDQQINQQFEQNYIIDPIQVIQNESANQTINNTDLTQQFNYQSINENTTIQNTDTMDAIAQDENISNSAEPLINLEQNDNLKQERQVCEPTQDDENYDITFLVILILITHIIIFIVEKSKKQNQIIIQEEDNMLTHELFELSVIFQEFIKFQKVYNENVLLSQALLEQQVPYID